MTAFSLRSCPAILVLAILAGCETRSTESNAPSISSAAAKAAPPTRELPPRTTSAAPVPMAREPEPTPRAERVFRPDDDRPRHDDEALERVGIKKYVSRRLILYTDIDKAKAVRLTPLVDELYEKLVGYFGELPPARDGRDWQITGYVMRDPEPFKTAGLIPSNLPTFNHGLNRRLRFWMREQSLDDYLEHLLLHEATHCFMTTLPAANAPPWYMEGMAEYFATHRTPTGSEVQFCIIPATPDEMQGFDRVTLLRKEVDAGRALSLDEVIGFSEAAFAEPLPYAWSWAVCCFLDSQPEYRDRFRELGDVAVRSRFQEQFDKKFADDGGFVGLKWEFFVRTLCYGYDASRAVLSIEAGETGFQEMTDVKVRADAGWQSARFRLKAGVTYELTADGEVTLADSPEPWLSDADGITLDYADGKPIGRLLASVIGDDSRLQGVSHTLFDPVDIGRTAVLKAPIDGTLYLRVNDGWNRLADNRGELSVHVRRIED
jgi:hypothetical protein